MLRLAALHPGQDFDAHAAAALADTDLPTAQAQLHNLCRDHLLQPAGPGRYTFHDLVRGYAAGQAWQALGDAGVRSAIERSLDHYLHTVAISSDVPPPSS